MTLEPAEKACSKCGEIKPLADFYRTNSSKDGRHSSCRICHLAAIKAHRAKQKAEDPEGFRRRNLESVTRHRAKTGNARGKAMNRARNEATRRLIEAHERQFDAIYLVVRSEMGLLTEQRDGTAS